METIRVLYVGGDGPGDGPPAGQVERERPALEVVTVPDAAGAVERLAEGRFDCVVTRAELPDADGVDLVRRLRESHPDVPLLLVTDREGAAAEAFDAGATDCLSPAGADRAAVLARRIGNYVGDPAGRRVGGILDALEAAGEGVYVLDAEGQFAYVGDAFADLLGYDPDELRGREWAAVYPDESDVERRHEVALPRAAADGWSDEAVYERADGGQVIAEESLARTDDGAVVGVVRDLSEQRRLEAELARNEEALARLYRITAERDLTFEEKLEQILELGCDRLGVPYGFLTAIDEGVQRIVVGVGSHPGLQSGASCPLSESYCRKTIDTDGLLGVLDAADEGWESDPAYQRFGLGCYLGGKVTVHGQVYGTLCFAGDRPRGEFTESEQTLVELLTRWASYELERRRDERRLQQKNERLSDFASVLSHDIRNPLNVARGRVDIARETGDTAHLDDVETALDRIEGLVTDLLMLAEEGEVIDDVTPVELGALARDSWQTTPTGDAELVVVDDLTLRADADRLEQLLGNLFANSVDHGGEGLTVRVGAADGGFYVEDSGEGIPEELRDRVLERGVSGGDGTGLGLDIVRRIAEAHGWSLSVGESPEGGARFEFGGVEVVAEPAVPDGAE